MSFTPRIRLDELATTLSALAEERQEVEALDVPPLITRWLVRIEEARGAHMSTRIEGNPMTEQQVRDAFERPERRVGRAEIENLNYRDAVRFADQAADDAAADVDGGLMRALHFIIMRGADDYGTAGQYRVEQNVVRDGQGRVLYMPPHETEVRARMDDLVQWLRAERMRMHPLILAAIAHAEFINVHPFDDGNGRVGRALTSYLLMRSGWRLRGFVRVEQVFGTDVQDYYAQLRKFGARYPVQSVDFTEWVAWFLQSLRQRINARVEEEFGWFRGQQVSQFELSEHGIAQRAATALLYVALFGSATSDDYAGEASVSHATAVADLNALVRVGYLAREGAARATRYIRGAGFPEVLRPPGRPSFLSAAAPALRPPSHE